MIEGKQFECSVVRVAVTLEPLCTGNERSSIEVPQGHDISWSICPSACFDIRGAICVVEPPWNTPKRSLNRPTRNTNSSPEHWVDPLRTNVNKVRCRGKERIKAKSGEFITERPQRISPNPQLLAAHRHPSRRHWLSNPVETPLVPSSPQPLSTRFLQEMSVSPMFRKNLAGDRSERKTFKHLCRLHL